MFNFDFCRRNRNRNQNRKNKKKTDKSTNGRDGTIQRNMTETATTQKQDDSLEETTKRNFVSRDKIITIEDLQKLGTFVFHYNFPCLYFFRPF